MTRPRLAVTHVTTFYPPENFGGDGVFVQRLAEAQVRRGHRVRVLHAPEAFHWLRGRQGAGVSGAAREPSAVPSGPEVRSYDGAGQRIEPVLVHQWGGPVLSRGWLRRQLMTARDDEMQVTHFHNVSLIGGATGFGLGRGVRLYTPHEFWLVCPTHMLFRYGREICTQRTCLRCVLHARRPPQAWRRWRHGQLTRPAVDRVLYPSAAAETVYRDAGLVADGTVLRHFLPAGYVAQAEARGPRPEAEDYFLYVGRLDAVKGIQKLLEHWEAAGIATPLWVVGDGPLGPTLRAAYADLDTIRFLGPREAEELGALYRDALALVMPASGHEIFGLVVAEAFAHGTPVVASAIGGSAELVERSGGGFLYSSREELVDALERVRGAERESLGGRGRALVAAELAEDNYLERYEELVVEACATNS